MGYAKQVGLKWFKISLSGWYLTQLGSGRLWSSQISACYEERTAHTGHLWLTDRTQGLGSKENEALLGCPWWSSGWDPMLLMQVAQVWSLVGELDHMFLFPKSSPTLCHPMNCSTSGFPNPSPSPRIFPSSYSLNQWCHPSHPLSLTHPFAFILSQHQDLFQRVGSSD